MQMSNGSAPVDRRMSNHGATVWAGGVDVVCGGGQAPAAGFSDGAMVGASRSSGNPEECNCNLEAVLIDGLIAWLCEYDCAFATGEKSGMLGD